MHLTRPLYSTHAGVVVVRQHLLDRVECFTLTNTASAHGLDSNRRSDHVHDLHHEKKAPIDYPSPAARCDLWTKKHERPRLSTVIPRERKSMLAYKHAGQYAWDACPFTLPETLG